jgi:hypothetical protein
VRESYWVGSVSDRASDHGTEKAPSLNEKDELAFARAHMCMSLCMYVCVCVSVSVPRWWT